MSYFTFYFCYNCTNSEMTDPCGFFPYIVTPSTLALSPVSFTLFLKDLRPRSEQSLQAHHSSRKCLWELTWKAFCIPVACITIPSHFSQRRRLVDALTPTTMPTWGLGVGLSREWELFFSWFLIFSELSPSSLLLLSFFPQGYWGR